MTSNDVFPASLSEIRTWDDLIRLDLALVWRVNDFMVDWKFNPYADSLISDNPFRDISLVTWAACVVGSMELGFSCMWVTIFNVFLAATVRRFLEAKRPVEYDKRLQPRTDRFAGSFGFPSLESHMAVVVFGYIALHLRNALLQLILVPAFAVIIALIGFSRVYSCARFPHQILASYLTGCVGLALGIQLRDHVPGYFPRRLVRLKHHGWGLVVVGFIVLVFIGLAIENGDCRYLTIFHTPRDELTRVLRGIFGSPSHTTSSGAAADGAAPRRRGTPRRRPPAGAGDVEGDTAALAEEVRTLKQRKRNPNSKDSFYHVHRTMLDREHRLQMSQAAIEREYKDREHLLPRTNERELPRRSVAREEKSV
mmetsp:Transcript_33622/g.106267  ORF Transcript_33622/g.106267 Transcript_33622/m.106267 type:complete len:367 (+) Transcript_33622:246-1346(+)|eukprot:CAMPEP_0118863670 /NCGR_PEP_ID=MMETSP1163-20130328/8456_1 /TAXON_ID=124430 /ORGANISM="Phaeomonas parva, Strain CCMP2877" /LENGTH=366 /DNA_ID=CAMNT_0006797699 /DNA_START=61 /DNA_END=1161 /DNA_ORIENTATION=-